MDVAAGSRYGLWHCCCDYPKMPTEKKEVERKRWDRLRESFREEWSKQFGEWPSDGTKAWPGHHLRDLQHGGNPVDPNNIFPAKPSVHDLYNRAYPACYSGQSPWDTTGADLPYTDN